MGVVRLLPTWSLGGVMCRVRVCCFLWFTNVQIARPSAAVDPSALFPSTAPGSQLSRSWCDMKISRLVPSLAQLGLGSSSTSLRLVLKIRGVVLPVAILTQKKWQSAYPASASVGLQWNSGRCCAAVACFPCFVLFSGTPTG